MPASNAAIHKIKISKIFAEDIITSHLRQSINVSEVNVENVLKPPQNPVAINKRTVSFSFAVFKKYPVMIPRIKHATTSQDQRCQGCG